MKTKMKEKCEECGLSIDLCLKIWELTFAQNLDERKILMKELRRLIKEEINQEENKNETKWSQIFG